MTSETFWLMIGFLGQALFSARFLVQWIVSEVRRESIVPYVFWWFSLGGVRPFWPMQSGGRTPCSSPGRPSAWSSICGT